MIVGFAPVVVQFQSQQQRQQTTTWQQQHRYSHFEKGICVDSKESNSSFNEYETNDFGAFQIETPVPSTIVSTTESVVIAVVIVGNDQGNNDSESC